MWSSCWGPGSGKGTQCAKIVEEFQYVHLSAGDLLRAERQLPSSEFGELIEGHIVAGTIVPVAITCSLLERAMQSSGKRQFLIDGFPRNKDNLDGWNKQMSEKVNLKMVLFFSCPLETCTARILARGEAGSGRSDDNVEVLTKRFKTFTNETMPVVEQYREQDLVKTVDGTQPPEAVFEAVKPFFQ